MPGRAYDQRPEQAAVEEAATPARALTLQQSVGNRAMARIAEGRRLARTQAETFKALKATKGYQALSEAERKRFDALIGGGTSLAEHAWQPLQKLLDTPGADLTKADTFKGFLTGKKWMNFDVRLPGEKRLTAKKFTVTPAVAVKDHPYRSGKKDAKKTVVTVVDAWPDGTDATMSIPIFEPKTFTPYKPGRILPKIDDLAKVLAELPLQSRARVKQVDLHPVKNPDDAYWEKNKEYNPTGKEFNSHMTAGADGVVDIFPSTANANPTEIETSMIHETGHVASNSKFGDDPADKRWDAWKKARKDDGQSLSQYGDSSDQEDAAESWLLFTSSIGTPLETEVRAMIPNRVKLMEEMLQHKAAPGGGIGGFFRAIGSGIVGAAKAVGSGIAGAAKAVGSGIASAAKAVGSGISKVFGKLKFW